MKKLISLVTSVALVLSVVAVGLTVAPLKASAAVTTGYAAVGEVNALITKAAVLLGNGVRADVTYTGTEPVPGAVYNYSEEDGVYTFTTVATNWDAHEQLTTDSIGITAYNWGGFGDAYNHIFTVLPGAPIFIRYSATSWRLVDRDGLTLENGATTLGYFATPTAGDSRPDLPYEMLFHTEMLVVGGYDETDSVIVAPTAAQTLTFDKDRTAEAGGWAWGNATLTVAPDSVGYAAVGEVDIGTKKAAVLLATGEVKNVDFYGTAPVAGAVYAYREYAGKYEFSLPTSSGSGFNWGNSNQLSNTMKADGVTPVIPGVGGPWKIELNGYGYFQPDSPANNSMYALSVGAPVFVRVTENRWKVYTNPAMANPWGDARRASALKFTDNNKKVTTQGYLLQRYDPGFANEYDSMTTNGSYWCDLLVIGNFGDSGILEPTYSTKDYAVAGAGVNSGLKSVKFVPEVIEEPPAPPVGVPDHQGAVVSKGLCAVGEVDGTNYKAAILLPDGSIKTVSLVDVVPEGGTLYSYEEYSNGYKLTELLFNTGVLDAPTSGLTGLPVNPRAVAGNPGELLFYKGGEEYYHNVLTADSVVYIRFSKTDWRVFKGADIIKVSDWPLWIYLHTTTPDADGNAKVVAGMVVAVDADATGVATAVKPADASNSRYFDSAMAGWTTGDKQVKIGAVVQPPVEKKVVETGVCAVGKIADGQAHILTTDKKIKTVKLEGGAPKAGTLNNYKIFEDGTCELTEYLFTMDGSANVSALANGTSWWAYFFDSPSSIHAENGDYQFDAEFTDDTVVFIRYSETEWRILTGDDAIVVTGGASHFWFSCTADKKVTYVLIGNYVDGIVAPELVDTIPFDTEGNGWANGDIMLDGSMSNPKTGADQGRLIVVLVLVAVAALAVVTFGRKRMGKVDPLANKS